MIISSGKLKQSVILIVVITVVAALLGVYFFFYIDTKEEDIKRRNFKVLAKSAHNIRQKIVEYSINKVTQNYLSYNLSYVLQNHADLLDDLRRTVDEDSVKNKVNELERHLKYEIEVVDKHELMLESFVAGRERDNKKRAGPVKNGTIEFADQTLKFVFRDTLRLCKDAPEVCTTCKCPVEKQFRITSSIPVNRFIEPLLHWDIFSEYVILEPPKSKKEFVIYESHPFSSKDSLDAALKSADDEVQLNGIAYKIFRFPFSVDKYDWVLIGLQEQESYLREARSFDLILLYTILLISLALLLSLPLIKVVLISRNEKLNRADVILCGVSLLTGCFFWTIIISQWDYDHLYKEDVAQENILSKLSNAIEENFVNEIDSAYNEIVLAENSPINTDL
ncbi:MAG TPA: hypothetical protein VFZ52_03380, partial [Chryseolinea sp.]